MELKKKLLFILTLAFICNSPANSQGIYHADKKLTVEALQEDFKVLRHVLENVHIGLYRYTNKGTMDSLFDNCFNLLKQPMTEIAFFKIISPIIVNIRDEHTFALPSGSYWKNEIGQTTYSNTVSDSKAKLFPFFIKVIGNRIFIESNLSEDLSLKAGDEIISINDRPVSQVLAILLPTIPTNGYIETFRRRHLEEFSLNQTYNRFMVHYAIFIDSPDTFRLGVNDKNKKAGVVKVAALSAEKIFNNYWRRYSTINDSKKRKENPLEFTFLSNKTAYLRLSDFHNNIWNRYNYSHSTEFRNYFEYIQHKDIQHLIIDLRGNEGGNPAIGIELLQYICTNTFRPYDYHEVKDYRFASLKQYFRDSTALAKYPDELFLATDHNTFRSNPQYKTELWSRPMQPSPNAFKKKIYVLINGATGSAASILATLIRVNRIDAIFIGEECGGDMEGPVSGAGTDITLPNTGIRIDIPFIKRVINLNGFKNQPGRGVIPDYVVQPTVDDIATNEDTELKFTLKLIKNK